MRCDHFDAGRCRSCTLLPVPMGARIAQAQERIAALLAPFAAPDHPDASQASTDSSTEASPSFSAPSSPSASPASSPGAAVEPSFGATPAFTLGAPPASSAARSPGATAASSPASAPAPSVGTSHASSPDQSDGTPPSDTPPASTSASSPGASLPGGIWRSPIVGPEAGFRNKAKMVVSGTAAQPILGIRDEAGAGIDLRDCPLYPEPIHRVLAHLPALIRRAQVPPYDVERRRGELKHVLATCGDGGALMLRFVLASPKAIGRIAEHLPSLVAAVPGVEVVTANINPAHTAVLEGPEEIHIAGPASLRVTQGRVPLRVRPQSFLQTNTAVAGRLYTQVGAWIDDLAHARAGAGPSAAAHTAHPGIAEPCTAHPSTTHPGTADSPQPLRVWDLFCGVGGFALHCAPHGPHPADRSVTGVELSEQAIASAAETAAELGLTADFIAADAFAWARAEAERSGPPDVLIVNPPRRGIGAAMAAWIEASGIPDVVYSSCNPTTLARDLRAMPSMRVRSAQLLDMFPHTAHAEVLTRLVRTSG